jgi:hypothetical protein
MVEGFDPAAFDIVRDEFQRDDDEIDRLREEERRLSEQRDIDRDRLRAEPRTVQERYDAGLLRGEELTRYERFLRQSGGETAEEREARVQRNIARRLLMEMTNDDTVVLTPEMVEVINDPQLRMTTNGEVTRLTGRDVIRKSGQFSRQALLPTLPGTRTKRKRKVSQYQKEFGKQLKMLKAKHPRTKITRLMKRAHSATRKAMK